MTQPISEKQARQLLQSDEDQLLEQLGMRAAAVTRDLALAGDVAPQLVAGDVLAMGVTDDLKALGRRILRRWNRVAHELACGKDSNDATTREDLKKALGLSEAAAIGVLTGALIGVGMMPALAPVLAAIVVKRFFNSAYDEFCEFWGERLE
jgi:cytochrome c biogenesis protein CcdA